MLCFLYTWGRSQVLLSNSERVCIDLDQFGLMWINAVSLEFTRHHWDSHGLACIRLVSLGLAWQLLPRQSRSKMALRGYFGWSGPLFRPFGTLLRGPGAGQNLYFLEFIQNAKNWALGGPWGPKIKKDQQNTYFFPYYPHVSP